MSARDIVFTVTIVAVIAFGFWWAFLDTAPRLSKAELDELIQQTDEEVADFQADIQRRSRLWDTPASPDLRYWGQYSATPGMHGSPDDPR